ncbi:hypothetical protein G5714_024651 [Onychostoma macrolepis]|uniref:Uncharacterized protein n=1 Tax=Onychostoma macrolepis TaxID=369639 RepID=A0A7J6BII2_9TELE|nr:hypothetical protein G5714_024651 [Onychostoma macrolepis]
MNGPSLPDPWAIPRTLKADAQRLSEGAHGAVARSNAARGAFSGETVNDGELRLSCPPGGRDPHVSASKSSDSEAVVDKTTSSYSPQPKEITLQASGVGRRSLSAKTTGSTKLLLASCTRMGESERNGENSSAALSLRSRLHMTPQAITSCGTSATAEAIQQGLDVGETLEKTSTLERRTFSRRLSQWGHVDRPLSAACA